MVDPGLFIFAVCWVVLGGLGWVGIRQEVPQSVHTTQLQAAISSMLRLPVRPAGASHDISCCGIIIMMIIWHEHVVPHYFPEKP